MATQVMSVLSMNGNEYDRDPILEWILDIGTVHSKIDHSFFRKAYKEASKSQNSSDFNYIPNLDAHPEMFLIQRFDKEMSDIAKEINANQGESAAYRHPFGSLLEHPNLKQLTKRDLSLHKRNMEIRALSRASVLSLIENQPDPSSPIKNSRRNSLNPKRNSIRGSMSGVDFFAVAATAAANVGLDDIALNLETSSIGFENNNTAGSSKRDNDTFETENILLLPDMSDEDSPDKFSNTIQYSTNQPSEIGLSPLDNSVRHTFHSNKAGAILQPLSRSEEYTNARSRSYSTNALEDMRFAKSDTDLLDDIVSRPKTSGDNRPKVSAENRPKTSADIRPKTGGESKPSTPDAMIGIRSKLKFEGASIDSPYFYHMTKEVHTLVVDAPPPGVPVKSSTPTLKSEIKMRGNSASNINPNNNSLSLTTKMPKIVDKYIPTSNITHQGSGTSMSLAMKLPPGIQQQQQAMYSPPNIGVSSKFNTITEPVRSASPLTSRSQKFSLEVREINDSVNSVLIPPVIGLNRGNSTSNLYKSSTSNLSHQSVGSSNSGLISEHRSSRVSPPGLLHIQPKRKNQSVRVSGQLPSSASQRLPLNRKMSIDFLVSAIGSTAEPMYENITDHHYHDNKVAHIQLESSVQRDKRQELKGIEITNLHSDPLYRILQEEIESLYSDANNNAIKPKGPAVQQPFQNMNYMLMSNNDSKVISVQQKQQQSFESSQVSSKKNKRVSKVLNSKTGLSDYRTRSLSSVIKPADLKILCSFKSLPSAVWFTCRITYFLIVSYYELMIRYNRNYELQLYLNMDELWRILEMQIMDYNITLETIESIYSWPLLQVIIEKYPLQFIKLLYNIEKYGSNQIALAKASQVSASSWVEDCSDVFYDIFPPSMLVCLRSMVKQGMRIFQSNDLKHTVVVSAQLCDWSKRVMAGIYASCLTRLRAKQSIGNTSHSELHSTSYYNSSKLLGTSIENEIVVPRNESHRLQSIFSSSLYGPSVYGNSTIKIQVLDDVASAEATMVPHFTFVLALEDVFNSQSFFDIKNIISKFQVPWNNEDCTIAHQSELRNSILPSGTLVRGLGLIKPTDRLDLLLIPPDINDIDNQLSIVKFTSPIISNTSTSEMHVESTVKQLLDIWLAIRNVYIDHVQYYSSSPFHRVCILPVDKTEIIRQQQNNRDQFTDNNMILQVNDKIIAKLLFPYVSQEQNGIHPVIEHVLRYGYSNITNTYNNTSTHSSIPKIAITQSSQRVTPINNQNNGSDSNTHSQLLSVPAAQTLGNRKIQADILVTHLRNGKIPQYFNSLNDISQIDFKFSLVLIDDFSPTTTISRPLSRYSSYLTQQQIQQQQPKHPVVLDKEVKDSKDIEPIVASATGPNTYMVCITDKITSWIAFQMACRLAKPSDTIVLVHIPVISNYNLKSISKQHRTSSNKQDNKYYLTFADYIKQKQICENRIESLINLYKGTGFNLYIDTIPSYEEELYRYVVYNQRDLYYESLINHYDHVEVYNQNNMKAPEYFLTNQQTYNISARLVAIINELTPDFVIIGGKCVDVQDILLLGNNSHNQGSYNYNSSNASLNEQKDLNFPYTQTVADNTVDLIRMQAEMDLLEQLHIPPHRIIHYDQTGSSNSNSSYNYNGLDAERGMYIDDMKSDFSLMGLNNSNHNHVIIEEGTQDIYDFDSFEREEHSESILLPILNSISDEDNYSGEFFEDNISQQEGKSKTKAQIVLKPSDVIPKLIINPHSLSLQSIDQSKLNSKQNLKELIKYITYAKNKVSLSEMLLHQYVSIHYKQQNNNPNYYNEQIDMHNNNSSNNTATTKEDILEVLMDMKRFSLIISNSNAF